jgi:hypothetical protein
LNYKFSDLNGFLRVVLAEKIAKVDILTEEPPINNLENDQHNTHKGQEKGKKRARK